MGPNASLLMENASSRLLTGRQNGDLSPARIGLRMVLAVTTIDAASDMTSHEIVHHLSLFTNANI